MGQTDPTRLTCDIGSHESSECKRDTEQATARPPTGARTENQAITNRAGTHLLRTGNQVHSVFHEHSHPVAQSNTQEIRQSRGAQQEHCRHIAGNRGPPPTRQRAGTYASQAAPEETTQSATPKGPPAESNPTRRRINTEGTPQHTHEAPRAERQQNAVPATNPRATELEAET